MPRYLVISTEIITMNAKIRALEKSDIGKVLSGWKAAFPFDDIPRERFENATLNDPNYVADGHLVAVHGKRVVGFVSAVARRGVLGQDGKGTPAEKEYGYIKGLFVLRNYSEPIILKQALLKHALTFIKSEGKSLVKVGHYTGSFLNPGIDVRYTNERQFYRRHGFDEVDYEEDVSINLINFTPSSYHIAVQQRVAELRVQIQPYQDDFLAEMKRFVKRLQYISWFPSGWEKDFPYQGTHLVAIKDGEIIGWAMYNPVFYEGFFGPIAVLQEFRRNGIGTALLLESMIMMKMEGMSTITAGWADAPFYLKSGWATSRRYAIFKKRLSKN